MSAAGYVWLNAAELRPVEVLREECDTVLCRIYREVQGDDQHTVLALLLTAEQPTAAKFDRLAHEYALKLDLDEAWAARPLELVREYGRTALVLEDPGGDPLDSLLGAPMETERFLRLAIAIASALTQVHRRGLIHKDIKPANILAD